MHSNYKLNNNNNNNNSHKSNSNNNNPHFNTIYDNGFQYVINGMKLLNPNLTTTTAGGGIGGGLSAPATPTIPPSPPPRSFSSYYKTASFPTAANESTESAHYCNMILKHSYYQHDYLGHIRGGDHVDNQNHYYNPQKQQQQQQQQQKQQQQQLHMQKASANHHHNRKHSPPPSVHQSSNNKAIRHNDSFKHYQQNKEKHLAAERFKLQSPDSASNSYSSEQHYNHYYSYYYNREPPSRPAKALQLKQDTNRKFIATLMASAKHKDHHILVEDAFPQRRLSGGGIGSSKHKKPVSQPISNDIDIMDNNRSAALQQQLLLQNQVLKEKMPNNNIIPSSYDNVEDWMNVNDVISEFIDIKDAGAYDKSKFNDAKEVKLRQMNHNTKRKMRTRSDSETNDIFYKLLPSDAWIDADIGADTDKAIKKYEQNNLKIVEIVDAGDDSVAVTYKAKLPLTPKKANGLTSVKKHSPPVHRVLLYNNPSPRLPRVPSSSMRVQEMRRARNKSPSNQTNRKQLDYTLNSLGENVLGNVPDVDIKKNHNLLGPREVGGGGGVNGVSVDAIDNDASSNDDDYDDLDNVSDFGDSADTDATTSGSEDGYRTHVYKMAHAANRMGSSVNSSVSFQSSEESLKNPDSLLVPSLFPFVPPYLAFSTNISKGPEVPPELFRVLKWRVSNVMPRVVRLVLTNSGMRLVKKTNDWMGVWGKHMKSPCFKTIRPYQKINHLPGSFKIGRKDACWRNLQKQMNKHGKKDFGFMPKTYIIPRDLGLLRKSWPKYAQRNVKWIIKPPASARGAGIRVVDRWAQIPKRKPLIVQKYIERPLLINGSKFDLRLYVLVTSINPLRVFLYHNGLARFASVKYSDKSDTLHDRCMHLTNYSINKFSSNYSKNEDVNACHGHKWTIKSLWSYLGNRGVRTEFLWEALRNLVLRTIMAGEQSINNMLKMNVESRYSCFELFGFDVLLDADLIPWLLEVNISPSLHSELPLDAHVKAPLVQAVLNTALYHVPPKLSLEKQKEISIGMSLPPGPICYDKRLYINYLSRAEKIKHNTFTRKTMEDRDEYINSILDNLTPDDIRCLIVAEDELARSAPLERIFPTNQTHKYLKYNEAPRYYNRLMDAWETRYGNNRSEGITLLREYCELKYHLEVPPSPAKKQLKYRTRALKVTRATGMALTARHMKSLAIRKSQRMMATCNNMPKFRLIRPQIENNEDFISTITSATTTEEEEVAEISENVEEKILKMPDAAGKRSSYSIKVE